MPNVRRRPVKLQVEKNIVICSIVSDKFLQKFINIHNSELFKSEYLSIIANWCTEHYAKHNVAPKQNIRRIYEMKKDDLGEGISELIENVLQELSSSYEEYETLDNGFEFEVAENYFLKMKLEQHHNKIAELVLNENLDLANQIAESYISPKNNNYAIKPIDVFQNINAVTKAFEEQASPLFFFEGAMGKMMNMYLTRGSLISIMGAEKKGKTWLTIAILIKAIQAGRKVAYFGVGDMTQNQMLVRFAIALAGRSNMKEFCNNVKSVIHAEYVDDIIEVEFSNAINQNPLSSEEAQDIVLDYGKQVGENTFRLYCCPTYSVTASDLRMMCRNWAKEDDYIPDVIIIDYPDILLPERYEKERRHYENSKWMELRGWSTDKEMGQPLIIVPTQIKASAYSKNYITMEDFSEDKRKHSHVTAGFGLNQINAEKEKQVMRINKVLVREGNCNPSKCCTITQCLNRGQFITDSFWKSTDENNSNNDFSRDF